MKKSEKGFTLVELLVVIAIMGVLGTIMLTNYSKYVDKSKQLAVDEQLGEIVKTFELAFIENEVYNDTTLIDYNSIVPFKEQVKDVYESLIDATLPENATLTMDENYLTYSYNGKTAKYKYA